jgi:hypothetical protein
MLGRIAASHDKEAAIASDLARALPEVPSHVA